jgi:hypothetical protein
MNKFTKVLRKANISFLQQRKIMHLIGNQNRTNYTRIMDLKTQYIDTKSDFPYKKKKKYNIRAISTEKDENTTTQKANTENVNTTNLTKAPIQEPLKHLKIFWFGTTKEIDSNKIKEDEKIRFNSDGYPEDYHIKFQQDREEESFGGSAKPT